MDKSLKSSPPNSNKLSKKRKPKKKPCRPYHQLFLFAFAKTFATQMLGKPAPSSLSQLLCTENLKRTRSLVKEVLGTQEPVVILRTGITTINTTGAGNILQVVNCDISGAQHWAFWSTIFDEYKQVTCRAHFVPWTMPCMTTFAATPATTLPVMVVVDYDDGSPPAGVSDLLAYDSQKVFYFGSHNPKTHTIHAQFQGIPDFTWQPTASPVIPAYFKMATFVGTPYLTLPVADVFLEFEVRFRQTV